MSISVRGLIAAWVLMAWAMAGHAQDAAQPAQPTLQEQQAQPGPPGAFEVATRYRLVVDSAIQAERAVERLATTGTLASDIEQAARRQSEQQALLASLVQTDYVRPERISRLRDQALLEDQRLEAIRARIFERLEELGGIRGRWVDRQRFWRSWREALGDDPDFALVSPDMGRAIARIDTVLDRVSGAAAALLELQRAVDDLRAQNEQIGAVVASIRTGRREALLRRDEPVLFSSPHLAQLAAGGWRAWNPFASLQPSAYVAFLRDHLGLLLFHVLLAAVLALITRRLRPRAGDAGWSGLLDHPWALGTFASVVLAMQRVTLAPPLWDVLLWTLFWGTAAVLSGRLFTVQALRLTVYLMATFYPVFLLLEVAQLPTPVFRVGLAAVAACALPVFLVLSRRRTAAAAEAGSSDPRRIWPLRIGAAVWAVVLVAVTLGYDLLGRWVLHASVTSAAVVFTVVALFALVRGGVAALVAIDATESPRFLRRASIRLAQRLVLLLQVIVVASAVLVLLDIWEITGSPIETWRRIAGAGFAVGPARLTVGRLLLAALVVYFAILASWLVRNFVQSEVYRRWDFDRGVGESINKLVHYTLVTIGFFIALAVIGVELQNFAIVAGALGIGIGFGLQNVVNNFASGLILLFERPVRVGDTVVVGGEWGTIRKIGLRSTIMLTFDQSEMIVPNADLVSEKVTNWTLSSPIARLILPVGVAYGSNIADVLSILRASGSAHESAMNDPPPQALFVGFGDSSLDFELRVWVREIRLRFEVRSAVLAEIERRLAEAGIEIPFPQRDMHLRSIDGAAADAVIRR